MSEILEYTVLLQRRRRREALAPAWMAMRWIISVERVSRTAREDDGGSEDVVIGWGDPRDKRVWMGESAQDVESEVRDNR